MEKSNVAIGARIKQAIAKSGISQKRLAMELRVSEPTINGYIQGRVGISAAGFVTISRLCKVSIDWLITGREAAIPEPTEQELTCELGEKEKRGLLVARDILEHYGLDNRFKVIEKRRAEDRLSEEERQLVKAYRDLPKETKQVQHITITHLAERERKIREEKLELHKTLGDQNEMIDLLTIGGQPTGKQSEKKSAGSRGKKAVKTEDAGTSEK